MALEAIASGDVDLDCMAWLDNFPELCAEILRLVPSTDRLRHVPLVSRRFCEACREPDLWPILRVVPLQLRSQARWKSFLRWLALRVSGLQTLVFGATSGPAPGCQLMEEVDGVAWERRMHQLLALLAASAPQLRSLDLKLGKLDPAAALLPALGQLSQLTSLEVNLGYAPVTTAQVNAVVQELPSLQRLVLRANNYESLIDGFPVGIASSCSQLRYLKSCCGQMGAVPTELGRLTALTELWLTRITSLPDSISQLSALQKLHVGDEGVGAVLPNGLAAMQQLTHLQLTHCDTSRSQVLGRLHFLRFLDIWLDEPPREVYWTRLNGLTELRLDCFKGSKLPAGLGAMTGLRKLRIETEGIDLPMGPYLSRLESLHLSFIETDCAQVPPVLVAATQLLHLDLALFNGRCEYIDLSAADAAIISSLPALVTLRLIEPGVSNPMMSATRLAHLESVCVARGRVPPAVLC